MQASRGSRATNRLLGAATPLVLVAGLVLAGWLGVWSIYAWAAEDERAILVLGGLALLALALPVLFLGVYERWQVGHGLHDALPGPRTRTLDRACGVLAVLLGLAAFALLLLFAFLGWALWSTGVLAASAYFTVLAVAMLAVPVAFARSYDRWRTRNGSP